MNKDSRILIACEESQVVTTEFRNLGFYNTFSCDLLPTSGLHPEWHLQQDVTELLKQKWDLMIAHPPCTFLTVTRNKWFKPEFDERFPTQHIDRADAISFFMQFTKTGIKHVAIENPIGIMSTIYQKPTQVISPHFFGDKSRKATCLWLKNLPPLIHTKEDNLFESQTHVEPDICIYKNGKGTCDKSYMYAPSQGKDRAKIRSKTFLGIAKAMATQWSEYILNC